MAFSCLRNLDDDGISLSGVALELLELLGVW